MPKLIPVDEKGASFTFLGSLIAANIAALFPEMRTGKCYLFRVTRDADHDIKEDEASDLLRTMQQHVRRMRFGDAVRLEVAANMPSEMVVVSHEALELTTEDVYAVDGPLNIPDLMQLYELDRPELKDRPLQLSHARTAAETETVLRPSSVRTSCCIIPTPRTARSPTLLTQRLLIRT